MSCLVYAVVDAVFAVLALFGLALILASLAIYDWLRVRVESVLIRWIMWMQGWPGYDDEVARQLRDDDVAGNAKEERINQ